ncbi:uncharacterized protein Z519_00118 [Cladophialophora bantiana CBS 173.52]|uniref:Uncharacterized protein n=1 Tax=Cladophialophora bantiana (strain ATCC 10958 / CBS 173.52 / CDC B-1940 / NIH 8579) TaxID=1442370 RepID=A0A0D2GJA7_CLAB1|nr:uncharacterized protein Z519_00118 [Cladophialophora bantiana CBS 173.52]KIW98457.1 hypothetical protein Z519_00118 [Cladophialophora bantiana CBS 173.52]
MDKPPTMSSTDKANLPKFLQAMESIYGPLPKAPDQNISKWVPPPAAEGHRGRYLWTDGFAVVNFLTLYQLTNESRYLTFAKNLITTVHNILGYTRNGKSRLPGATDSHPLDGGLRIGKHDESGPDGDGQYFHYLTVWMFALNRTSLVSGERWYNDQAISMAKAILPHFMSNMESIRPRMFWKVSMDLSRPLVMSEGNLDPVDGYVTYKLLQSTNADDPEILSEEVSLFKKIVDKKLRDYASTDTLDLGMTLWTAHWFTPEEEWATHLTCRAIGCVKMLLENDYFDQPSRRRLAFREFGTALGVKAALSSKTDEGGLCREDELVDAEFRELPDLICRTWEEAGLVPVPTKKMQGRMAELMPITAVMYATALIPGLMNKQP